MSVGSVVLKSARLQERRVSGLDVWYSRSRRDAAAEGC